MSKSKHKPSVSKADRAKAPQDLLDKADRAKGDPPPERPEPLHQEPPTPVANPIKPTANELTPEARCLDEIKDVLDKYGMTLGVRHVEFSVRPRGEQ